MRLRDASTVPATSSAPTADDTVPVGGMKPDVVPDALGIGVGAIAGEGVGVDGVGVAGGGVAGADAAPAGT